MPHDRSSWSAVTRWIGELKEHEPACRIVLVGTKLDLVREGQERDMAEEEVELFCEEINAHYLETSAMTGENVREIFDLVTNEYVKHFGAELLEREHDSARYERLNVSEPKGRRRGCC